MDTVHIFCCSNRFTTDDSFAQFIEPTYTDDGDILDSEFMREIGLSDDYEPMAIERMLLNETAPVSTAITDCSYSAQFVDQIPLETVADAIICVYTPNIPRTPSSTSLSYIGAFTYDRNAG